MTRFLPPILAALATAFASGPTAASAAAARHGRFESSVIRHVNAVRAHHGLPRVRASRPLGRAADRHSRDMLARDFFSHSSSNGRAYDQRIRRFIGAQLVGETLAVLGPAGGGAATVVRMWVDSPPHRAILLGGGFRRIGVGRRAGMLGATPRAVVTADFASAR